MTNNLLVTGATGFLGPHLVESLSSMGTVIPTSRHTSEHACDLTDAPSVARLIAEVRPRLVVHTAAMTDVDLCEKNPNIAMAVNKGATETLVRLLPSDVPFVYISTDQVYSGIGSPHAEGSEAPLNVYGKSKLAGEMAVQQHACALIVRTNIFGVSRNKTGSSLVDFLVTKLRAREPITLFHDVLFSPLHVTTLITLLIECIQRHVFGVFNAGSRHGMSKECFARSVAAHLGLQTETARPGRSSDMPARAVRPLDMRLSVARIEKALGRVMPSLEDEIRKL